MTAGTILLGVRARSPRLAWLDCGKVLALVLMLWEHVNDHVVELVSRDWWYQPGRLVFPLFAIVLGLGLRKATDDQLFRVLRRLCVLSVLAQLAWLGVGVYGDRALELLNVVVTLCCGVLLVVADRVARGGFADKVRASAFVGLAMAFGANAEFGIVGVLLVWAVQSGRRLDMWALLLALSVWQRSPVPLLAPIVLELLQVGFGDRPGFMPRAAFGVAYVGHALAISLALWALDGAGA